MTLTNTKNKTKNVDAFSWYEVVVFVYEDQHSWDSTQNVLY